VEIQLRSVCANWCMLKLKYNCH